METFLQELDKIFQTEEKKKAPKSQEEILKGIRKPLPPSTQVIPAKKGKGPYKRQKRVDY